MAEGETMMTTETTTRRNGKWAKITRTGKSYTVACGFDGTIKAARVTSGSKDYAEIAAENWLNDDN
jgi:hypothetical protein